MLSTMPKCPGWSREEDEEIQRSTKKVEEIHSPAGEHCPSFLAPFRGLGSSFRDKLLGDIPGAYEQAFDFE